MDTTLLPLSGRPACSSELDRLTPTSLVTPALHASLILPEGRKGIVVLGGRKPYMDGQGNEEWRWYNVGAKACEVREAIYRHAPSFITLNAFTPRPQRGRDDYRTHPCKRVANVAAFGAVWLDLDTYNKAAWKCASEQGVVWEILDRLAQAGRTARGIPQPSYIVQSGNGFHVVWLTEAVPAKARKAWSALQTILNDLFVDMGRDTSVMPASANLRLVGTTNSGNPVRMIWPSTVGEIVRHSFRDLCRAAFPYTPEQVATYKEEKAAAKAVRKAAAVSRIRSGSSPVLTGQSYYRTLQSDVEALCRGRYPHGVSKGERNTWLLALSKVWAWTMGPKALRERVAEWAPHLGLTVATALTQAGAVIRRAEAQDRSDVPLGKRGRYPVGPKVLGAELGVTVTEARRFDLRMMIPASMKRDRAAERQEKSRRSRGVKARNAMQDARLAIGQQALALMAQGLTRASVMEQLGVKKSYLDKALAEARAVAAAAAMPKLKPTRVEPAPEPAETPSREVSRYIARDEDVVPVLEGCGSAAYSAPVHDVAAPHRDPQPVEQPRPLGGLSRSGPYVGRVPVVPLFLRHLQRA